MFVRVNHEFFYIRFVSVMLRKSIFIIYANVYCKFKACYDEKKKKIQHILQSIYGETLILFKFHFKRADQNLKFNFGFLILATIFRLFTDSICFSFFFQTLLTFFSNELEPIKNIAFLLALLFLHLLRV